MLSDIMFKTRDIFERIVKYIFDEGNQKSNFLQVTYCRYRNVLTYTAMH